MDRDHKCGTPAANDGWLLQHFFDGGHGLVAYPMDCFDGRADPLVAHLRKIPKSKIGTASIRVANSGLTRARAQRIARELVRLRKGKAWVKVMHTAGSGREVREILDEGGVTHLDTQDCPSTEKDTAFNHALRRVRRVLRRRLGEGGQRPRTVPAGLIIQLRHSGVELVVVDAVHLHVSHASTRFWGAQIRRPPARRGCQVPGP